MATGESLAAQRLARVTASPSSLTKDWTGASSRSSTNSDGRHSRTPFGVTTMVRLIRDRVLEHKIDQLVVAPFGIGEAKLGIGRALFAQLLSTLGAGSPHRFYFDHSRIIVDGRGFA
jgi:hypothetical protein